MPDSPRLVTVGMVGDTEIRADATHLSPARPVRVTLSSDYELLNPPGWPERPHFTGAEHALRFPRTILARVTVALLKPEADALVAAGAATYA
jgi:hypothetical protein